MKHPAPFVFFLSLLSPIAGLCAPAHMAAVVKTCVEIKAESFDLHQVRLLEGPFMQAQETTRNLLLRIDSNRLLYPFRREAGIPSPIQGPDTLGYTATGHLLGHYLSACAQLYRSTGDEAIKAKADALVAALAECQANLGNGYLGGFPEKAILQLEGLDKGPNLNAGVPWYCLHKIYAGLLDMHTLAGNQQALEVLIKAADWAERNLSQLTEPQVQAMLEVEHGGINEVFANLATVTGQEKYLSLSLRLNHQTVMEPFAKGEDRLDNLHANTQIPKFLGLARQYQLTGDSRLHTMATAFWEAITRERSYVTGGNSSHEHFTPKGNLSHFVQGWTAESCNSYNMLKLSRCLFATDPKPAYSDYYERTLYNHILASRHPENGGQLYFQVMESGHHKGEPFRGVGWRFPFNELAPSATGLGGESTCCSGSSLESTTKFNDSIYFHQGKTELFVNLFIPSELEWNGLTLRQETRFPEQGRTRLTFSCKKPAPLKLNVRRPWWAGDFQLSVNGRMQPVSSKPGSYAQIDRSWRDGDTVEVIMPMSFRLESFPDNPKRGALMYGPLVMAAITGHGNPFSVIRGSDGKFLETLKPVAGKVLEFTGPAEVFRTSPFVVAEEPVVFRPLHTIFGGDSFAFHWDVVGPEEFQRGADLLESELSRLKTVEARTVDVVLCRGSGGGILVRGEMFNFQTHFVADRQWNPRSPEAVREGAHKITLVGANFLKPKGPEAYAEVYQSEMPFHLMGDFRMLAPGVTCSYQMKLPADATPRELEVRLWRSALVEKGAPARKGVLEVVVEGKLIGRIEPDSLAAGEFSSKTFPLSADLVAGKANLDLTLRVPDNAGTVYGIYECRILK